MGIDLVDPNIPGSQMKKAGNVIDLFRIIHGVVGCSVGGGLTVLRAGTPYTLIPLKYNFRQEAQTDEKYSAGEQVWQTEKEFPGVFWEKPQKCHTDADHYQKPNPP